MIASVVTPAPASSTAAAAADEPSNVSEMEEQTSGPQPVSVALGYVQPTVATHSMLPPRLTGAALAVATPRAMAASVVVAMVGMMQWLIHVGKRKEFDGRWRCVVCGVW